MYLYTVTGFATTSNGFATTYIGFVRTLFGFSVTYKLSVYSTYLCSTETRIELNQLVRNSGVRKWRVLVFDL